MTPEEWLDAATRDPAPDDLGRTSSAIRAVLRRTRSWADEAPDLTPANSTTDWQHQRAWDGIQITQILQEHLDGPR